MVAHATKLPGGQTTGFTVQFFALLGIAPLQGDVAPFARLYELSVEKQIYYSDL